MRRKCLERMTNLVVILALIIATGGIGLFPQTSMAATFTEDFSTATRKDSANTTADWDTAGGMVKLPNNWQEAYDSPETTIWSLAVYNNKLYAGSYSNGIIYVYDGSTWSLSYDSPEYDIWSLAVYNNKLYAGSANNGIIYVYDGSSWSLSYDSPETDIYSLAVYNNKLYAGSYPNGKIYVYDGSSWSLSYDSTETDIYSLAVYNNKLYAGSYPNGKIYVYDGSSWSLSYDSTETFIYSLTAYNNKLYAGSYPNGKIYVYDGSSWSVSYDSPEDGIYSLAVYNNKLYAGSGDNGKIYVYDGSTWSTSYDSPEDYIYSLAVYNNKLYAGSYPNGIIYVCQPSAQAQSIKINTTTENIVKATLMPVQSLNGQTINYYLSANGGTNWEQVTPNAEHLFSNQGNDLRWRAILSTTDNSVTPEIDSLTIDYFADTTPPTGSIVINSGATYTTTTNVTLTLSATDTETGVQGMRFSNDGSSWSIWESFASVKSWNLFSGDGTKTVYIKYKDGAYPANGSTYSDNIILDSTKPTGSILINNGAYSTTSNQVNLNLSASDALSGVEKMIISNNPNFSGSAWEAYNTSKSWTLAGGAGTLSIYVKFKDRAGNESRIYSDSINLITQKRVIRLYGDTRYETAVAISNEGWKAGANTVILTRGDLFPDALAGSSISAKYNAPILLTWPSELHPSTKTEIERLKAKNVIILGSENAVSKNVEESIRALGIISITRIGGIDRYDTAGLIAQALGTTSEKTAFIATGENFPDALASASFAYYKRIPIFLVGNDKISAEIQKAFTNLGIKKVIPVGGTDVVPDSYVNWFVQKGATVETRLSGDDRYGTAKAIADYGISKGMNALKVYIATGENFPDALACGPLAGKNNSVILLTSNNLLRQQTKDWITSNKANIYSVYIAGGPDVVSEDVKGDIAKILGI